MRSLRITAYAHTPITLPLAYNELLQGVLYSCWHGRYPQLHDEGLGGIRGFRPFTFGRLRGKSSVSRESRTIRFEGAVSFDVRSPVEELLDELATQLAEREQIRIGAYNLPLTNLQSNDRLLFPPRATITLATPVVAYEALEDGHTRFYAPDETPWLSLVQRNAQYKAEALGLEGAAAIQAMPLTETLRKQVTRFKGTYITGWLGDVILAAEPPLMAALWCLGLGVKNSQGFGMFDISDKPL